MSDIPKFKTYALTIRPLDGITDKQVESSMVFIRRRCEYYHVVTEKTGSSRHLHAGIILKDPCVRSNMLTNLLRLFKDLTPQEKTVLRSGLKIMYNWDFVNAYLDKDDDTVVIASNLPESGHIESFFPPKPVVQDKQKKCSLYYHELESLWYAHSPPGIEINTVTARDFLFRVMYSLRVLPVIRDDKQIVQTARHLVRWLNKQETNTIELPCFEKEE